MDPIINPLWIYFAGISENINILLTVLIICFGAILFVWIILYITGEIKNKCPKWMYIITVILSILLAITPSQKTILSMVTVSQITPNNIEIAGNTIESTVDYIFEKIDEITDEDDKD